MPDPVDPTELQFGEPAPTQETEPESTEPQEGQLADSFLSNVPPQDRAIVSRYIKEWDKGVTKKFQDYSSKLKPYEALGVPLEDLQQFVNIGTAFKSDPELVFRNMYHAMQEHFGEDFEGELARILQIELENEMNEQEEGQEQYEVEPDPNEVFQQNVMSELEEFKSWREQQEAAAQEAEEMQQLDGVLEQMHTKYGQFDDDWVLNRLSQHGNIDQAMKEWNAMLGQYAQPKPPRQAPKTMAGQGGVPATNGIDPTKLDAKARRDLVANVLAQVQEGG